MPYRITTRDGTAYEVEDADVAVISAYLTLEGYPPVSVELMGADSAQLDDLMKLARDVRRVCLVRPDLAKHRETA